MNPTCQPVARNVLSVARLASISGEMNRTRRGHYAYLNGPLGGRWGTSSLCRVRYRFRKEHGLNSKFTFAEPSKVYGGVYHQPQHQQSLELKYLDCFVLKVHLSSLVIQSLTNYMSVDYFYRILFTGNSIRMKHSAISCCNVRSNVSPKAVVTRECRNKRFILRI